MLAVLRVFHCMTNCALKGLNLHFRFISHPSVDSASGAFAGNDESTIMDTGGINE